MKWGGRAVSGLPKRKEVFPDTQLDDVCKNLDRNMGYSRVRHPVAAEQCRALWLPCGIQVTSIDLNDFSVEALEPTRLRGWMLGLVVVRSQAQVSFASASIVASRTGPLLWKATWRKPRRGFEGFGERGWWSVANPV